MLEPLRFVCFVCCCIVPISMPDVSFVSLSTWVPAHPLLCWSAGHYQELVAQANLASRRALQAQQAELEFVRQTHTALEQAQPQRAQQLEEEARKARLCHRCCLCAC